MFTNMTKTRILAVLLALVLVLSTMLVSCGERKIEDPAELFKYAEMKSLDGVLASFTDAYDDYLGNITNSKAASGISSLDIDLSEEALGMIELLAEMDLSWLSNIGIDCEAYTDKDFISGKISLLLGESRIADIQMMIDKADSSVCFAIPEALTKTLKIQGDASSISLALFENLPSGDSLANIVKKYVEIFVSGIEKVEKSDGTLTANGVSENCTVVKATLTEIDAANILKQMIETAKTDAELKTLITNIGDTLAQMPNADIEGGEELYNSFIEDLEWKLEDIDEMDSERSDEIDAFIVTDYINSKNEIIGRALSNDQGEFISYGKAEKDGSFGFELKIEEEKVLRGEGKTGKTINGTFIIGDGDNDCAEIILKDIDEKLTKGTVDVKLLESFDLVGEEMLSAFLKVYSLRISFESSADKMNFKLSVMNGEDEFASISMKGEEKKVEKLTVPTEDVIVIDENIDFSALMGALDLSSLIENMKNSPIPSEIVSIIELYLAMAG